MKYLPAIAMCTVYLMLAIIYMVTQSNEVLSGILGFAIYGHISLLHKYING